jgi:hypothetical protein
MLISLDPGVQVAGVAIFEDFELSRAFLVRGDGWHETASNAWDIIRDSYPASVLILADVVVEIPQIYDTRQIDVNDLITLSLMAGAFVGKGSPFVTTYLPAQWKGQVPKRIMTNRTKNKLSPEECARVELPSARGLQHNVWDAVGIGLHHLRKERRAGKKKSNDRA